jgi:hypothetical protein
VKKVKRVLLAEKLNDLASEFVGDCKGVNVFFVSDGRDVVTVSYDFDIAYQHWQQLAGRHPLTECTLEDRRSGVLASVGPILDEDTRLVRLDYTHVLRGQL